MRIDGIDIRQSAQAFSFVIAPCRELDDEMTVRCLPEQAQFWTLYYTVPPITDGAWTPADDLDGLQMALADFDSEGEALAFAEKIRAGRPLYRNVHGYARLT